MLKKSIKILCHWSLLLIGSWFICYVLLLNFIHVATPYLQHHRSQIAEKINITIASIYPNHPVTIGTVAAGNRAWQPVLQLHHVTILDATDARILWQADEISIGFNWLRSLMLRQISIGLISIKGIKQNSNDNSNNPVTPTAVTIKLNFNDLLWLFTKAKVNVEVKTNNVNLNLAPEFITNVAACATGSSNHPVFNKLLPTTGNITFKLHDTNFTADQWLASSIGVHEVYAHASWQNSTDVLNIKLSKIQTKLPHVTLDGHGEINWLKHNNSLPDVALNLNFSATNLARLSNYFPTKIMHPDLAHWLQHAFEIQKNHGKIDGTVVLRGNLANFPVTSRNSDDIKHLENEQDKNDKGTVFRVEMLLNGVDLWYERDWPLLTNIKGRAIFTGDGMEIFATSAKVTDIPISHTKVVIDNWRASVLAITGQTQTDTNLAQRFITLSPLRKTIGKNLAHIILTGRMALDLTMTVPLLDHQPTKIIGNISLFNNNLLIPSGNVKLQNLVGNINFTDETITAPNLNATLFNQAMTLNITSNKDHNSNNNNATKTITKISFAGKINIADLQQYFDLPLTLYATGNTAYQGTLQLPHLADRNIVLDIFSNLQGVKINFPALINKPIAAKNDLQLRFNFADDFSKSTLLLQYADKANIALEFRKNKGKERTEFTSGIVSLGKEKITTTPTTTGLLITGKLDKMDWTQWQQYLFGEEKIEQNKKNKSEKNKFFSTNLINLIDLEIAEFQGWGQTISPLHLIAEPQKKQWLIKVQSPVIKGKIDIPKNLEQKTVIADLQQLYLKSPNEEDEKEKSTINPRELPAFDVMIDDFHFDDKSLGHIEFQTTPMKDGLSIDQLIINSINFQVEASGKWQRLGSSMQQSTIQGKCSSKNVGDTLKQLNFTKNLAYGIGAANFVLMWQDVFFNPDIASMSGNVTIDIRSGRIINLEGSTETKVGIGKLLSVIGLQTLPRRLTLDFSDLLKNGFSFDIMKGSFKLIAGNAFTTNTEVNGPVAKIKVAGRIGFDKKDYDISLSVVPRLTASLPMIATVAGGPVIGAAAWLADRVIGNEVSRVITYIYQVKGSWAAPDIQKI